MAPMQSAEQNVPWDASRRQRAQTGLLQRSQFATAGVSEWFWHWEPMARHLVPSATMGMGSSEGGASCSSLEEAGAEGPSSKMESIFFTPPPAGTTDSTTAATNLGTSWPLANALWQSEEQNVPSFSSTTHMRQIDFSHALQVASAIDSEWLAQLFSMRSSMLPPGLSITHGKSEMNGRCEKSWGKGRFGVSSSTG